MHVFQFLKIFLKIFDQKVFIDLSLIFKIFIKNALKTIQNYFPNEKLCFHW